MTLTLDLTPIEELQLIALADKAGMEPARYLRSLIAVPGVADETTRNSSTALPNGALGRYHDLVDLKHTTGLSPEEESEFAQLDESLDEADWNAPGEQASIQICDERVKAQLATLDAIIEQLRKLKAI